MKVLVASLLIGLFSASASANPNRDLLAEKTMAAKLEGTYYVHSLEMRNNRLVVTIGTSVPSLGTDYLVCNDEPSKFPYRYDLLKTALVAGRTVVISKKLNYSCIEDIVLQ